MGIPHNVKVIVAMHKSYAVPKDELYMPLHVGADVEPKKRIVDVSSIKDNDGKFTADKIPGDNTGENISMKNPLFCELTGLYWAWKNLPESEAEAVGLAHYRRHFTMSSRAHIKRHGIMNSVLTQTQARELFVNGDIVVPKKRKYYIETLYSHYDHTFSGMHLDLARGIIMEKYPEYIPFVDRVYAETSGYMFNMMILKRDDLNEYCSFLFDVLFEMEERLNADGYLASVDDFTARLFGRVSEILFNAWVEKRRLDGSRIAEVPYISTEKVNWGKKGGAFLAAKFFNKKYGSSF